MRTYNTHKNTTNSSQNTPAQPSIKDTTKWQPAQDSFVAHTSTALGMTERACEAQKAIYRQNEPISPLRAEPCDCSAGSCTPEAGVTLPHMSTSATHDPQQGVGRSRPTPPANVAHEDAHHRPPFDCAQGDVGVFGVTQCSYGKYSVKVAPSPSSEVTLRVPLWAEMIRSTTANPRPVPVSLLV